MVQQTLAEANESFAAFRGNSLPELFDWLAAILNHNVSDAVRQHVLAQRRTVKAECRLDDSSEAAQNRDGCAPPIRRRLAWSLTARRRSERLRAALECLPPRQREAVRLRHLEGRPLADIAIELSCTRQAAAAIIAQGITLFARGLARPRLVRGG